MEPRDLEAQLELLHPLGFAWALRCCRGDRAEAEDVLHLAYEKVLAGRVEFRGEAAFKTWLFGVIRRTAFEQYRWTWRQALRAAQWWREQREPASEEDELDRATRVARLQEAMGALSPKQAEVIHLVFYQDLSLTEAANVLGMQAGTIRTHYERGKAKLRALLGEKELVG